MSEAVGKGHFVVDCNVWVVVRVVWEGQYFSTPLSINIDEFLDGGFDDCFLFVIVSGGQIRGIVQLTSSA